MKILKNIVFIVTYLTGITRGVLIDGGAPWFKEQLRKLYIVS